MSLLNLAGLTCRSKEKAMAPPVILNRELIDSLGNLYGDNLAILSCLRCDCFRDFYNHQYNNFGAKPAGYVLFADTNCTRLDFPVIMLPSPLQKEISEDIYNVTFIKRKTDTIEYRILSVKETKDIPAIARSFFARQD